MTSPAANWSAPGNEPLRNQGEVAIQVQQMGLKVHYTFDKLEQTRCLARLPQLIQVQSLALDDKTTIGLIDLNLCLTAVSQGSPELIHACTNPQSTVDYAVYVYDYSEPDTPLVGHGMLSGLLQAEGQNTELASNAGVSAGNSSMVTGLVTRNLLAMFGKGISHTLEVKMKFSESQRVIAKAAIVAPQPVRYPVAVPSISEIQSSIEPLLTPAGSAEWSMLVQSNPQLAAQLAHLTPVQQSRALTMDAASRGQSPALAPSSRVASPAVAPPITRQNSYTDSSQQPPMHHLQQTFQIQQTQPQQLHQQSSRQGTPMEAPPAVAPTKEKAVLETVPLGDQAPSRPSSRASRKRATTGRPRGRPRKNATPSEANGNTSGYEDGTDDDPPPKRRATMTTVQKSLNTPFASVPESLRVAASTSGSLRAFRPLGLSDPSNAPSHIQDIPRAPTPVPFAEKVKPRVTGSLRRTSTLNKEHNQSAGAHSEDARSPNDQPLAAPTPFSEVSTPDFGSSPPMPRTAQFFHRSSPAPSSPILPPMPMSTNDSGFMSGGLDDLHEYSRQAARGVRQKTSKIHGRDPRIPVHVFHAVNGAPVVYKNSVDATTKHKSTNGPPLPPPPQRTEPSAAADQTGPPLAHSTLYAPPQPKRPLSRLDQSQQSSAACSPENNVQLQFAPPTFGQQSPKVNSAPVTPAQTVEVDTQGIATENPSISQPQADNTSQQATSMNPPQSKEVSNQSGHVQFKQRSGQKNDTASNNSHLSAGQTAYESQAASHSQSLENHNMIMTELGFSSAENRAFSNVDGPGFVVGDLMALGQVMGNAQTQGNADEAALAESESMMQALSKAMEKVEAEAEASTTTSDPTAPAQSTLHCRESATPPEEETETAAPEPAKANQESHFSRKTPNSVTATPHPTSYSEAPCPPSDSAIMLPYPSVAATSPPTGGRSNKNYVKKLAIKEKLEQAVMNGEMPPFCSNCGAIETPTWRKIYVQECTGTPAYHEYSDKPGRVTAIEITTRDDAQNPTGYRMMKKSLAGDDDKSKWSDALLCNPCGIWLCKNNRHRPMDRWDKDAERLGQERRKRGTGRAPVRKRKNTSASSLANANANANAASQLVLTTEANFMADPPGPVDYASSIPEGRLALPTTSLGTVTGQFDSKNYNHNADNSQADSAATVNNGQPQYDNTGNTPENYDFGDLGNTRRLLFPSAGNARSRTVRKPLDERSLNPTRPPNRRHNEHPKSSLEDNTLLAMSEADSLAFDNEIEALFRSPMRAFERPSTPPGHSSTRELDFKTPSRPTPSHRPITRSVSRSIRSVRSNRDLSAHDSMQETPSRTGIRPSSSAVTELRAPESPSLRRSPRINKGLRSLEKKILTIGGRQVEAAMSDIDAALAEFNQSITDESTPGHSYHGQQQSHRQARSSMQSPEKSDLDPYLKSSMVDQWSPTKEWASAFGMEMLNQDDLQLLESFQQGVGEEPGSSST